MTTPTRIDADALALEIAHLRDTVRELHRRCQRAEGIIAQAGFVEGRPQGAEGRGLGRALANYAAETYRRERDEARAEVVRLRKTLSLIAHGIDNSAWDRPARDAADAVAGWAAGLARAALASDGGEGET